MSLYRTVYAPDGSPFEVSPERASDLVLNQGWSNTAPKTTATTGKKTRKAEEDAPAADTTEVAEPGAPVPD